MIHTITRINCENNMPRYRSQTENQTYCMAASHETSQIGKSIEKERQISGDQGQGGTRVTNGYEACLAGAGLMKTP